MSTTVLKHYVIFTSVYRFSTKWWQCLLLSAQKLKSTHARYMYHDKQMMIHVCLVLPKYTCTFCCNLIHQYFIFTCRLWQSTTFPYSSMEMVAQVHIQALWLCGCVHQAFSIVHFELPCPIKMCTGKGWGTKSSTQLFGVWRFHGLSTWSTIRWRWSVAGRRGPADDGTDVASTAG